MKWKKSSFCKADQPMCAEVTKHTNGGSSIRNSKNPEASVFFDEDEWQVFIAGVKAGEFD